MSWVYEPSAFLWILITLYYPRIGNFEFPGTADVVAMFNPVTVLMLQLCDALPAGPHASHITNSTTHSQWKV